MGGGRGAARPRCRGAAVRPGPSPRFCALAFLPGPRIKSSLLTTDCGLLTTRDSRLTTHDSLLYYSRLTTLLLPKVHWEGLTATEH